MSTTFNCPACQQLIAAEVDPGTQVMCPLCRQIVIVPGPDGVASVGGPFGPNTGFGSPPPGSMYPPQISGVGVLPYGAVPQVQGSQGMAVGALVCGIVGLVGCPLVGVVGVILGIVALVRTNREPQRYGGRGLAIGGIVTGAVGILLVPVMIAVLLPSLGRARELSKRTVCNANLCSLGQALYVYAQDDNMFPDASADWQACLVNSNNFTITPMQFICPSTTDRGCSYHYVPGYGTMSDPTQILAYDDPANHQGEGGNILYLDGHVAWVRSPKFEADIAAIKLPNGEPRKPYEEDEQSDEEAEAPR